MGADNVAGVRMDPRGVVHTDLCRSCASGALPRRSELQALLSPGQVIGVQKVDADQG